MKILFLSDIHGINKNLNYIKKLDETKNFDKVVVLGDLYYGGLNYTLDEEVSGISVKDFLMSLNDKLICLKGNCDAEVDIKVSDFPISELSLIHTDGIDIYCTHGNIYNIDNDKKLNRKGVLIYGHTHVPFIKRKNDMIFINTGSISLPRNGSSPSYTIYENKVFTIYDVSNNIFDTISLN